MNRLERLVVLGGLVLLTLGLFTLRPLPAVIGAAAGVAGGVVVAGRLTRLRTTVEARIGTDEPPPPRGVRRSVLLTRATLLGAVLVALWVGTLLVPFAGERAYAATAAAAMGLSAVLTAERLLPHGHRPPPSRGR